MKREQHFVTLLSGPISSQLSSLKVFQFMGVDSGEIPYRSGKCIDMSMIALIKSGSTSK